MSPALKDGEYIVTIKPRFLQRSRLRPGHIFVLDHPDLGRIVKRLVRVEDGRYYFGGDNKKSTPEALITPVTASHLVGKMLFRVRR